MRFPDHPERRPTVVTGASSGIGAATARTLAAAGFPVALGARRVERCEQLAEQIRGDGGEAVAHHLDLGDEDSLKAFAVAVESDLGDVEVVVSNAALLGAGRVHEVPSSSFADELGINLVGTHRLVRAFVPGMIERGRGDLVFVSSDVAERARPRMSSYATSKWGLEGMAATMRMELEGTGVRASVVRPGQTLTEMGWSWDEADMVAALEDWQRWGLARHSHFLRPDAIAAAIHTVISTPRGTHLTAIDVQPEAPLEKP